MFFFVYYNKLYIHISHYVYFYDDTFFCVGDILNIQNQDYRVSQLSNQSIHCEPVNGGNPPVDLHRVMYSTTATPLSRNMASNIAKQSITLIQMNRTDIVGQNTTNNNNANNNSTTDNNNNNNNNNTITINDSNNNITNNNTTTTTNNNNESNYSDNDNNNNSDNDENSKVNKNKSENDNNNNKSNKPDKPLEIESQQSDHSKNPLRKNPSINSLPLSLVASQKEKDRNNMVILMDQSHSNISFN
ncbi:histidine kinase, partial [Reticulomyxa filosa]